MKIRYAVVVIFAMRLMADMGSGQISGPVLGYVNRGADLRAVEVEVGEHDVGPGHQRRVHEDAPGRVLEHEGVDRGGGRGPGRAVLK